MLNELKLPKTLAKRLEKVAGMAHINPDSILKTALTDRLDYLEWKENTIAEGQADLDNDRVVSTAQIRESLAEQRAQRAYKNQKAA